MATLWHIIVAYLVEVTQYGMEVPSTVLVIVTVATIRFSYVIVDLELEVTQWEFVIVEQ